MIGRSIGNYKIVRAIGEGGMGTVYLAEHPMIGKRVAVKMLRPDLGTDPGLVSRFFQEARSVNEIRHPNIVDISDYGKTEDGIVYLVMELLEGRSLRDRLNSEGALPLDEAVTISRQVCDALAAAHRVGIVHRDLKPDNIFLLADPTQPGAIRSKLFDFGVAKLLGEQEKQVGHKTIAGSVVGTPYYMSPEQALCQDVGAASDIYSMGVVMFEMVTGHVPFAAEQLVILLNAILKQPAPAASESRPEVPPFLDRLILRCLEKDPGGRPQTMEEVVALLNAGAAELAGQAVGFGETMAAGPGLGNLSSTRSSGASPVTMTARTSAPRSRTTLAPQTAPARTTETAPAARTIAPRDGASVAASVGRSGSARQGGSRLLGLARGWLNSPRVVRAAIPLAIVAAVIIVASVFMSTASAPPVTSEVLAEQPPPPPATTHAAITLDSEPAGAEVTRVNDGRLLGTTPLVDIRPANRQQINYRFRLAGYTDVQVPFQATSGGNFEVKVDLEPKAREPSRSASSASPRKPSSSKAKRGEPAARPAAATPAPVAQPSRDTDSSSTLPPLNPSVRVRRIGGR